MFNRFALSGMSIRAKLFVLVCSLILILVISAMILRGVLSENVRLNQEQSKIIQVLREITILRKHFSDLRFVYNSFLNDPSPEGIGEIRDNIRMFGTHIKVLEKYDLEEVKELEFYLQRLDVIAQKISVLDDRDVWFDHPLYADANSIKITMDEIFTAIKDHFEDILENISEDTLENARYLQQVPLLFLVAGMLTVLVGTIIIIVDIFLPVAKIKRAMASAAIDTEHADQYVLEVHETDDEIAETSLELNHLLREVSSGIEQIREAERRLRETGKYLQAIMDNVVDGLIILDEKGIIESFSPSAEKIFGLDSKSAIGLEIVDLFNCNNNKGNGGIDILRSPRFHRLAGKRPRDFEACRSDGSCTSVELAIGKTRYAGRNLYIVTVRDITARKQMETFIEHAQRMETIGRMTGGIAHDFNNMLTVISGNLEILERKISGDSQLAELVQSALESVERGTELTGRLLAFSRKQLLKPEYININALLPEIATLSRRVVREDIELIIEPGEDLWHSRIDPMQFENAVINLAINSRDAIAGFGKIAMRTENIVIGDDLENYPTSEMRPGAYVKMSVTDNGSGIRKEVLEHVFEPFFTTKDIGKGTGLGLSMVYGFTRQSGGFVVIDSEPGKGTTVSLYFPKAEERQARPHQPPPQTGTDQQPEDNIGSDVPRGTESILVVEDEAELLNYLTEILRELGYRVTQAKNGKNAISRLARRKNLGLLLTDVVMPGGINGEELAREVHEKFPDAKILFMSGYTKDALVDQGNLREGVNLISKPFTRKQIAQKIREVLDS